jgi:uncharacterized membrane protein YkoI
MNLRRSLLVAAAVGLSVSVVFASQTYIGMKKARAIASKQVAGKITSSELEKEHGKMVYSFDIRTADGGITEVVINAKTGDVISTTVESAEDEAKEQAEAKKKKKT